jgi:hypothetical protein
MSVAEGIAAVIVSAALACAGSGCSGASSESSSPRATETGVGTSAATEDARGRLLLGDVIVQGDRREGTVIRDRATHGKRFLLTGIQASECLSYLKANPAAAARDLRAACPGNAVAEERRQMSQHSTKP